MRGMKAAGPGSGMIFRVIVSGFTAFLIVSVMSMAFGLVVSASEMGGGVSGGVTGRLIGINPGAAYLYLTAQMIVAIVTFLGSFHVLSKK